MPPYVKVIAILVLVSTILGGIGYYHISEKKASFEAGYNKAKAEYLESNQKALSSDISEKIELLNESLRLSRENDQRANEKATEVVKLVEEVRVTLDDLQEYRQVASSIDCDNLGDDFVRLWNNPIEGYLGAD